MRALFARGVAFRPPFTWIADPRSLAALPLAAGLPNRRLHRPRNAPRFAAEAESSPETPAQVTASPACGVRPSGRPPGLLPGVDLRSFTPHGTCHGTLGGCQLIACISSRNASCRRKGRIPARAYAEG